MGVVQVANAPEVAAGDFVGRTCHRRARVHEPIVLLESARANS